MRRHLARRSASASSRRSTPTTSNWKLSRPLLRGKRARRHATGRVGPRSCDPGWTCGVGAGAAGRGAHRALGTAVISSLWMARMCDLRWLAVLVGRHRTEDVTPRCARERFTRRRGAAERGPCPARSTERAVGRTRASSCTLGTESAWSSGAARASLRPQTPSPGRSTSCPSAYVSYSRRACGQRGTSSWQRTCSSSSTQGHDLVHTRKTYFFARLQAILLEPCHCGAGRFAEQAHEHTSPLRWLRATLSAGP